MEIIYALAFVLWPSMALSGSTYNQGVTTISVNKNIYGFYQNGDYGLNFEWSHLTHVIDMGFYVK